MPSALTTPTPSTTVPGAGACVGLVSSSKISPSTDCPSGTRTSRTELSPPGSSFRILVFLIRCVVPSVAIAPPWIEGNPFLLLARNSGSGPSRSFGTTAQRLAMKPISSSPSASSSSPGSLSSSSDGAMIAFFAWGIRAARRRFWLISESK